jgi:hypothetical protein
MIIPLINITTTAMMIIAIITLGLVLLKFFFFSFSLLIYIFCRFCSFKYVGPKISGRLFFYVCLFGLRRGSSCGPGWGRADYRWWKHRAGSWYLLVFASLQGY